MNGLASLLSVIAGAWSAWNFGFWLSWWFGWTQSGWLGPLLVFLASYLTANAVLSSALSVLQLSGGGIWTATPVRWVVGKFAFLLLLAGAVWVVGLFLPLAGMSWGVFLWWSAPMLPFHVPTPPHLAEWQISVLGYDHPFAGFAAFMVLILTIAAVWKVMQWERIAVAWCTRPLRRLWRAMKTGVGGSSAFGGLLDEWDGMQWKPGRVMVGASLYEPGQRLGKSDDRHFITIATSRSGKGRSAVIPNLLTWPGSALVIDPKGENAAVTARWRKVHLRQKVHIVDPFRMLERPEIACRLSPESREAGRFASQRLNPLAEIRLDDIDAVEQIRNLGAALVMPSQQGNPFWDNAARQILDGIMGWTPPAFLPPWCMF